MATTLERDASWYEIDPEFYRHGGNCFSEAELLALADLEGEQALVFPANGGEEALSIANLGAVVTVFDTAENSKRARALADAAGASLAFVEGEPGHEERDLCVVPADEGFVGRDDPLAGQR